jgi:hypothetical protein
VADWAIAIRSASRKPVKLRASQPSEAAAVYVFDTREGANGIMQLQWADDPPTLTVHAGSETTRLVAPHS